MMILTTIFTILPSLCSALVAGAANVEERSHGLVRRETKFNVMCWWDSPSSAIVRDQLYINGGRLRTGNITNTGGSWILDGSLSVSDIPESSYYLNLGTAFNVSDPPFHPLEVESKTTQVSYGFMGANDNGFWLYGGFIRDTDAISRYPTADEIEVYDVYRQGAERNWERGWQDGAALSNGVNRYVAGGAGVNVPDLNTTYYFSGLRHQEWAEIRGPGAVREKYRANVTSSQLITASLSDQVRTEWQNITLPRHVRPRVSAEMVYVPAGKLGTLVVIGGVTNALWMAPSFDEEDSGAYNRAINRSIETGPSYVRTVEVYDISSKTWYLQNTTGEFPPAMAQHCAVVASAEDGSSHQIYVYGGSSGQGIEIPLVDYDQVYVLSIPAFEWIKVYDGENTKGRRAHRCLKPFPDQMLVVGGVKGASETCLTEGMVRLFNLNDLEFKNEYDPKKFGKYKVPEPVFKVIGGNDKGGATKTISRWAAPTLETVFMDEKPPSKAQTWYPYPSVNPSDTSAPTVSMIVPKPTTPKFVYPVVAVCIVVVLAIVAGCIAFLCIRRKKQKAAAKSAGHEQFQGAQKDDKVAEYYQQYASAQTSPYNTVNSMSTLAYGHHRQYSQDGYVLDQSGGMVHELPSERNPAELDAGQELAQKLAAVKESPEADPLSITPTPATEVSDPMTTTANRRASQRTARVSVFSEMTSSNDDEQPPAVSPLSPDPEITTDPMTANTGVSAVSPSEGSWWRKRGSKLGSKTAKRFSSFSSSKSAKE